MTAGSFGALLASFLVFVAYYGFFHLGLLLAMLRWEARSLLTEAVTLAAVGGFFLLRFKDIAYHLCLGS